MKYSIIPKPVRYDVKETETDHYILPETINCIGSETASTIRSRKSRMLKAEKIQKALQCNAFSFQFHTLECILSTNPCSSEKNHRYTFLFSFKRLRMSLPILKTRTAGVMLWRSFFFCYIKEQQSADIRICLIIMAGSQRVEGARLVIYLLSIKAVLQQKSRFCSRDAIYQLSASTNMKQSQNTCTGIFTPLGATQPVILLIFIYHNR